MLRVHVFDANSVTFDTLNTITKRRDWKTTFSPSPRDDQPLVNPLPWDVVVVSLNANNLPASLGLIQTICDREPPILVVAINEQRSPPAAISAIQAGAIDAIAQPFQQDELEELFDRLDEIGRLNQLATSSDDGSLIRVSPQPEIDAGDLIGHCAAMQQVFKAIGRVAGQDVSVLIRGESGSGKEVVARELYRYSRRSKGPFLAVNCAAIPDALLESELFGHEKGAFTGADRQRAGKFELCHRGTLFLDEIGDMDLTLQSKLLRVLQEKTFERVGGQTVLTADVRVIAATHRPLEQMCASGRFREDLFYRINGYAIELPPLRARADDLRLLVEHFLRLANQQLGTSLKTIAPEAMELMVTYSWPGNIRELQSVVRHAALESAGTTVLLADFLPASVRAGFSGASAAWASAARIASGDHYDSQFESGNQQRAASQVRPLSEGPISEPRRRAVTFEQTVYEMLRSRVPDLYDRVVEEVERRLLKMVLNDVRGNQSEAAKLLGITRTTLRTKLNRLRLGVKQIIDERAHLANHHTRSSEPLANESDSSFSRTDANEDRLPSAEEET